MSLQFKGRLIKALPLETGISKAGKEVEVYFNLQSKEFNGKYYTSADCWKVTKIGSEQPNDDLPFG